MKPVVFKPGNGSSLGEVTARGHEGDFQEAWPRPVSGPGCWLHRCAHLVEIRRSVHLKFAHFPAYMLYSIIHFLKVNFWIHSKAACKNK